MLEHHIRTLASLIEKRVKLSEKHYYIYSHNDLDGLSSLFLMKVYLETKNISCDYTILTHISDEIFQDLKYPFILMDLGSNLTPSELGDSYVIDHHILPKDSAWVFQENFINPRIEDDLMGDYFSTSMVTFCLMLEDSPGNSRYWLPAYLGLLADQQQNKAVHQKLLRFLIQKNEVFSQKDIAFYGIYSRPLSMLSRFNKKFPGIAEISETIGSKLDDSLLGELFWRDLLTEDREMIIETFDLPIENKELFLNENLLENLPEINQDPKALVAMLNAACRLEKFNTVLEFYEYATEKSSDLSRSGNPFENLRATKKVYSSILLKAIKKIPALMVKEFNTFHFINFEQETPANTVGVLAAMKLDDYSKSILCIAALSEGSEYKVSFRAKEGCLYNIGETMLVLQEEELVNSAGGHPHAGGARVLKENLSKFLQRVDDIFLNI